MEDFNWLKKQASPNWRIMEQDRHEHLKHKAEVLRNKNIVFSEELNILPAWVNGYIQLYNLYTTPRSFIFKINKIT